MAGTLASLLVSLDLDVDKFSKSTTKAIKDTDDLIDHIDRLGSKGGAAFLRMTDSLAKIPTAIAAINGVTAVASSAAGALGVLPAAGVAVGVGMTAAKVGMQGFSDAMSSMEDPAKFAESLKTLSPAARASAIAVRELRDDWERMQNSVQEQLFAGTAQHISKLGTTYLPVLGKGLGGVASEFNGAIKETAAWLAKTEQVKTVSGIFGNVKESVGNLAGGMQPLLQIFMDVVAVGSEFLPGLTSGFGDAASAAADFVSEARRTGDLHRWISTGLSTLGDLWQLLKNIGSIVGTVFSAFDTAGGGTLQTLIDLTGRVKEFLQSVEGQQALRSLAEALTTVAGVVVNVLLTALRQLAPVITAAAPGFAELATQVGTALVAALRVAGPLLVGVAGFLSDNVTWLGPLALGLYGAVQAFQAVTAAVRILNIISAVNPWVVIITATIALVTLIITHWDEIKAAVGAAWQWLATRASELWGWIKRNIVDNVTDAAAWVGRKIQDILNFFTWLGELPGKALEWFGGVLRAAGDKLGQVIQFFRDLPGKILGAIGDFGNLLYEAGKDLLGGLWRGIESMVQRLVDGIKNIARKLLDAAKSVLGISSPSKEFHDIGVWLGKGFIDGLDAMQPKIVAAAERIANAAMVDVAAPVIPAPRMASPRMPVLPDAGDGTALTSTAVPGQGGGERALVSIENYHPPADASPGQVATELDWLSRSGGH